ncbi:cobalamin-binding protein [Neiella marina]|uniref:Cobalamin-binding protein n=1 Tax=Neiella holothuriorum TaxID=2870530 RepID=A0ABS7EDE7_9GAMM|nr:cobalamin-binding protein [Neiella holothuriorum]MBW8190265.1 cobalamin-binding protein [Neiella holothuriorum]
MSLVFDWFALRRIKYTLLLVCVLVTANTQATPTMDVAPAAVASATPPSRVIALAPNLVEMIYALGADHLMVGAIEHSNYPSEAKQLPVIGNYAQLNIERIVALQPDLLIAWRGGSPPADVERLQQLGLRVVWINIQTFNDVADALTLLGEVLGHQRDAQPLVSRYLAQLDSIRRQYQHAAPITVFYELWPQPLTTVGLGSWPQQALALCGADNPFAKAMGDYPQVSLEHVIATQPQVIIQPLDSARGIALTDWQRWPTVPAVSHQAIVTPDSDKLHRMTPRALDEAAKLCRQLDEYRKVYRTTD